MKKYMVIVLLDGEQSAHFTDDYTTAHNMAMDAECGLGAYAEIYVRVQNEEYGDYYSQM